MNESALVQWVSVNEENFAYYELQRSADGQSWHSIAEQAGKAEASQQAFALATEIQARKEAQRLDYDMQMRMKQIDRDAELAAYTRAKAFEIEKMETRSRLDFERNERERLSYINRIDTKIASLQDAVDQDKASSEEVRDTIALLEAKKYGIENEVATLLKSRGFGGVFGGGNFGSELTGSSVTTEGTGASVPSSTPSSRVIATNYEDPKNPKYIVYTADGKTISKAPEEEVVAIDSSGRQYVMPMYEYMGNRDAKGYTLTTLSPKSPQIVQAMDEQRRKSQITERTVAETINPLYWLGQANELAEGKYGPYDPGQRVRKGMSSVGRIGR
jgi:hypothetical protein